MAIHLSEYSETWVNDFLQLAQPLITALDGHGGQGIEHVGSTAVPGMPGRPIIDIAVIAAPAEMAEAAEALQKVGYLPVESVEEIVAAAAVKFRAPNSTALHSLTLFDESALELHTQIAIRNVLMENDALAAEFAGYKRGIVKGAALYGDLSIAEYQKAKAPMFAKILRASGMAEAQISEVAEMFSHSQNEANSGDHSA